MAMCQIDVLGISWVIVKGSTTMPATIKSLADKGIWSMLGQGRHKWVSVWVVCWLSAVEAWDSLSGQKVFFKSAYHTLYQSAPLTYGNSETTVSEKKVSAPASKRVTVVQVECSSLTKYWITNRAKKGQLQQPHHVRSLFLNKTKIQIPAYLLSRWNPLLSGCRWG